MLIQRPRHSLGEFDSDVYILRHRPTKSFDQGRQQPQAVHQLIETLTLLTRREADRLLRSGACIPQPHTIIGRNNDQPWHGALRLLRSRDEGLPGIHTVQPEVSVFEQGGSPPKDRAGLSVCAERGHHE